MARRSRISQPYFQRVSVPGMSPHFEPLDPDTETGFLQPAPRPAQPAWWQRGLPRMPQWHWPAMPRLGRGFWLTLASLLLLALAALAVQQASRFWSQPAVPEQPLPQKPLRVLLSAVDECRGSESLLVMLPEGNEREAALERLQRQQRQIDLWLRENGAWLAATHGGPALLELRDAVTTWRQLQKRITEAEVVQAFNGRARESRNLMAGPSGEAYRHVLALVERLERN